MAAHVDSWQVVPMMQMLAWISQKALDEPDTTHRLFFVGVTRAMQRLYILAPLTAHYYTIGEPIV